MSVTVEVPGRLVPIKSAAATAYERKIAAHESIFRRWEDRVAPMSGALRELYVKKGWVLEEKAS